MKLKKAVDLRNKLGRNIGRLLYGAFLTPIAGVAFSLPAHAAGDNIWTKASEVMRDVYTQILGISTVAAVVTAAVALVTSQG